MSENTSIAREALADNDEAGRTSAILHALDALEALERRVAELEGPWDCGCTGEHTSGCLAKLDY